MARPVEFMMIAAVLTAFSSGCIDTKKIALNTTSKILLKAQPGLKQEADYDLAARAIPGALKTVEGFQLADPTNRRLTGILAEGYCQYATGFIEDEYEIALIKKDFDLADHQSKRATKIFLRCMGYGLTMLSGKWDGGDWAKHVVGDPNALSGRLENVGKNKRDALFWVANGLAGAINFSKDDPDMIAKLTNARLLLERVVAIDKDHPPKDKAKGALPRIALGMLNTAIPKALGGQPELGAEHFKAAIQITEGKFLLAKVLFARRYAVATQNRALFRETLVKVLQTDPAIWPGQRLANEIAHRRAHRYLKQEKEWF